MPLLRAGDVREPLVTTFVGGDSLSQCPCCGRAMCGLSTSRATRGRSELSQCPCCGRAMCGPTTAPAAVTRADGSQCPCCGRAMCGSVRPDVQRRAVGLSQCPCCGRAMCGPELVDARPEHQQPVSMPLLRAGDVRGEQAARWAVRVALSLQWGRHQSMSEGRVQQGKRQRIFNVLQWGRHQSMSEGRHGRERRAGRACLEL